MKRVFTRQEEENDCGYAVCVTLINSLQLANVSIDELKFKFNFDCDQLSLEDIKKILNSYYIDIDVFESSIEKLIFTYGRPMIMFLQNEDSQYHFVVCYEKKKGHYLISDPSENDLHWVAQNELQKKYCNIVAVAKKERDYEIPKIKIKQLNNIMATETKMFILTMCINFFMSVGFIMASNFSKLYFNNIVSQTKQYIHLFFIGFIILNLAIFLVEFLISILEGAIKKRIRIKAINDFVNRFQLISADEFESVPMEKWVAKIQSISFYIDYRFSIFVTIPTKFLLFAFSLLVLTKINYIFLLFSLLQNILTTIISFYFSKLARRISFNQENTNLKTNILMSDIFYGHESIQAKNLTSTFSKRVGDSLKNFSGSEEKNNIKILAMSKAFQIITQAIYFLIMYWCVKLIQKSEINVGDLLFYFSINIYINQFATALMNLIRERPNYFLHASELNYIYNELSTERKRKLDFKINSIALDDVSKIRNGELICEPIRERITNNTFFWGKSGIGKSTIFKIINGSYEKYSGSVYLNEYNIRDFSITDLASHIFYLGQYDYLFSDSVFENVKMFTEIDLSKFVEYQIFDILSAHNISLDKKLKNNGSNLSKGQRQIINFIATLFISRDVFIIDESLSNVDEKTAEQLLQLFFSVHKDSLLIFCSHNKKYQSLFKKRIEVK